MVGGCYIWLWRRYNGIPFIIYINIHSLSYFFFIILLPHVFTSCFINDSNTKTSQSHNYTITMVTNNSLSNYMDSSYLDDYEDTKRKRVGKACNACRIKKTKVSHPIITTTFLALKLLCICVAPIFHCHDILNSYYQIMSNILQIMALSWVAPLDPSFFFGYFNSYLVFKLTLIFSLVWWS